MKAKLVQGNFKKNTTHQKVKIAVAQGDGIDPEI